MMTQRERAMLTVKDVGARVEALRAIVHDPETAHAEEDNLYLLVLRAIAEGHPDGPALAAAALAAEEIEFHRWYA